MTNSDLQAALKIAGVPEMEHPDNFLEGIQIRSLLKWVAEQYRDGQIYWTAYGDRWAVWRETRKLPELMGDGDTLLEALVAATLAAGEAT